MRLYDHDYVGQNFGHLKVIAKYNKKYLQCQCDCGNIKNINIYDLLKNRIITCGCYSKRFNIKNYNKSWTGHKEISGKKWGAIKYNAKKRNIELSLSIEDAYSIYCKQQKLCNLSNLPISFDNNSASLDRIESNRAYTIDNCQWVHKDINKIKLNLQQEKFIELCNLISNDKDNILEDINIEIYKRNKNWNGYKNIGSTYWTRTINGAKQRKLSFDISIKEAWETYINQNGRCALSKIPIFFQPPCGFIENNISKASLDRIDSKKGYKKNNIQWITSEINTIKNNFDQNYFIQLCSLVAVKHKLPAEKLNSILLPCYPLIINNLTIERKQRKSIGGTSNFKGVAYCKRDKIWRTTINNNGKCIHIGNFQCEIEAAQHYDYNIIKIHGKNNGCYLNFPNFNYDNFKLKPKGLRKDKKTKYNGITKKSDFKWRARINIKNKRLHIGYFDTEIEAAQHYDFHAIKLYGNNKYVLNFPNFNYNNFIPKVDIYIKQPCPEKIC